MSVVAIAELQDELRPAIRVLIIRQDSSKIRGRDQSLMISLEKTRICAIPRNIKSFRENIEEILKTVEIKAKLTKRTVLHQLVVADEGREGPFSKFLGQRGQGIEITRYEAHLQSTSGCSQSEGRVSPWRSSDRDRPESRTHSPNKRRQRPGSRGRSVISYVWRDRDRQ